MDTGAFFAATIFVDPFYLPGSEFWPVAWPIFLFSRIIGPQMTFKFGEFGVKKNWHGIMGDVPVARA